MNLFNLFYGGNRHETEAQRNPQGLRLLPAVIKWHWSRLIGLNLLFLLTCVPVVTIPMAMTAMSRVLGLMIRRKVTYPAHDYWNAFKGEWRRSLGAGWIQMALLLCGLLGVWFYPRAVAGMGGTMIAGVCLVVALMSVAASIYLYPMVAFTELTVKDLVRNAVLLMLARLPQTAAVLLFAAVVLVIAYAGGLFTVWILPLFGFSLIGLAGVYAAWGAITKLVLAEGEGTGEPSEETERVSA